MNLKLTGVFNETREDKDRSSTAFKSASGKLVDEKLSSE